MHKSLKILAVIIYAIYDNMRPFHKCSVRGILLLNFKMFLGLCLLKTVGNHELLNYLTDVVTYGAVVPVS